MAWYRCGGTPSEVLSLPTPSEASGAIARFNTDLTENLLSAVAEFSASQASGTPTPSTPIPIVGVDKVNVVCCGKNLIDWKISSTAKQVYLPSGTYTLSWNGTLASGLWYIRGYDESGNLYTDKSYLGLGASWTHSSSSHWNYATMNNPFSFTVPVGCSAIELLRQNENGTISAQLEEGSTATTYEPYNGTTALINLGGTYYGGEVDAVTGKITLTRKIVDMGDLSWSYVSANNLFSSNVIADMEVLPWNTELQGKFLCECGKPKAPNTAWSNLVDYEYGTLNGAIRFKDSNFTDPALFKANISGNKIMYPLATTVVVYASNTAEIPTIVGDNQVFADSGNIAVKFFETVGHKI